MAPAIRRLRRLHSHVSWGKLGLCLALLGGQLFALKTLPYSQTRLTVIDGQEADAATSSLELDGLTWDTGPYVHAPALEPIRAVVRASCPGLGGYETGTCLTHMFASRFAYGAPRREFFDREHDPVAVFRAHLEGAPGHCVSRAGMLATALLASGHPARVVQIIARETTIGHNAVEVWDGARGWRLLDPLFAGTMDTDDGSTAAITLASGAGNPRWRPDDSLWKVPGVNQAGALEHYGESRLRGAIVVYPEPWLYTRVGESSASWPFFGRFLIIGPRSFRVGWGQQILQIGILVACLGLVTVLCSDTARMLRRAHQRVRGEASRRRAVQSTS